MTPWQAEQLLAGNERLLLGRYKLLTRLSVAAGDYLAEQTPGGRLVSLTVFPRSRFPRRDRLSSFLAELAAIAAVKHPNLIAILAADVIDECRLVITEHVGGHSLEQIIATIGRLPVLWSAECIRQAALGLDHALRSGFAHRDLRPGHLLVAAGWPLHLKVLQLGMARLKARVAQEESKEDAALQPSGGQPQTRDVLSSEPAPDRAVTDARSDVFDLGVVFFQMVTGHLPYEGIRTRNGSADDDRLAARLGAGPPRASSLEPGLAPEVDELLARMLVRSPEDRLQTPGEVAARLENFLSAKARDSRVGYHREHEVLTRLLDEADDAEDGSALEHGGPPPPPDAALDLTGVRWSPLGTGVSPGAELWLG